MSTWVDLPLLLPRGRLRSLACPPWALTALGPQPLPLLGLAPARRGGCALQRVPRDAPRGGVAAIRR
eukprot:15482674-Alexandrium_andersonii.AAC.1